MNWTEFECTEQIFQSQSADEQIEQWKLRPQQTEVFNSALAIFRAIGSKLKTEQLCIPFFWFEGITTVKPGFSGNGKTYGRFHTRFDLWTSKNI